MKPELHPEAAKNFDEKAQAVLAKVAPATEPAPSEWPTHMARPGAHAHVVSEEDLIDFEVVGQEDQLGRTTARYFEHEGQRYGLEDDRYVELARLSEAIQRTNALRDVVSTKWVEDVIVDWIKDRYSGAATTALTDFLTKRCEEDVKDYEIWFPVAQLSLERDLPFGNVVFKTISEEMLDRLEEDAQKAKEQALEAGRSEEYVAQFDIMIERMRHDLQGLAASSITVNAEPQRAFEVALRESERAVAALGLYHVAATMLPEVSSYTALLGRENVEEIRQLKVEGGRIRGEVKQVMHKPIVNFHLSDEDISSYKRLSGFDNVSELLTLESRTDFQEALLDALLLYSRSTRERDLAGRLVYMLVAIESVLVKNPNEAIQQNVGERMAFIITNNPEKRRATVDNLKAAYALRSKFVHHGRTIDELETVRVFMIDAWALFIALAKDSRRFDTKEQLIDHLEKMKLS